MALARDAGLEVRLVDPDGASDVAAPATSGVCRVRGAVWVVLSNSDPLDIQLDVLAQALRTHAGRWIEERYLPPAVRQRVSG
jgi:hypothetical protein